VIYFKDKPTIDPSSVGVDTTLPHTGIYTNKSMITEKEGEKYDYILCPVTNFRHLVPAKFAHKVIYLDDKTWLYYNVNSTAEYTVSTLLMAIRRHKWELRNANIGMLGYGRVGQQVAEILVDGFDCVVFAHDPNPIIYGLELPKKYLKLTTKKKVLDNCDIILVLASEQKDLSPILDIEDVRSKKEMIVVNSARSSLVSQEAIAYVINNNGLYTTDTIDSYDHEFVRMYETTRRFLITPHIGGSSTRSRRLTDGYVISQFLQKVNRCLN